MKRSEIKFLLNLLVSNRKKVVVKNSSKLASYLLLVAIVIGAIIVEPPACAAKFIKAQTSTCLCDVNLLVKTISIPHLHQNEYVGLHCCGFPIYINRNFAALQAHTLLWPEELCHVYFRQFFQSKLINNIIPVVRPTRSNRNKPGWHVTDIHQNNADPRSNRFALGIRKNFWISEIKVSPISNTRCPIGFLEVLTLENTNHNKTTGEYGYQEGKSITWIVPPIKLVGSIILFLGFIGFIVSMIFSFGSHENPSVGAPLYIVSLVVISMGVWLVIG